MIHEPAKLIIGAALQVYDAAVADLTRRLPFNPLLERVEFLYDPLTRLLLFFPDDILYPLSPGPGVLHGDLFRTHTREALLDLLLCINRLPLRDLLHRPGRFRPGRGLHRRPWHSGAGLDLQRDCFHLSRFHLRNFLHPPRAYGENEQQVKDYRYDDTYVEHLIAARVGPFLPLSVSGVPLSHSSPPPSASSSSLSLSSSASFVTSSALSTASDALSLACSYSPSSKRLLASLRRSIALSWSDLS